MTPLQEATPKLLKSCYNVVFNGKVLGYIPRSGAQRIADKLRVLKIKEETPKRVPKVTEIVLVLDRKKHAGQFPGLYIFTGP